MTPEQIATSRCHCTYCDPANWPDTNGPRCKAALRIAELEAQLAEARADGERRSLDAAKKILEDCLDRRGIKWEFQKVDKKIIKESILPAWAAIIDAARGKAGV